MTSNRSNTDEASESRKAPSPSRATKGGTTIGYTCPTDVTTVATSVTDAVDERRGSGPASWPGSACRP